MKWLLDIIAAVLKIFANKTDPEMVKRKDAKEANAEATKAVEVTRSRDKDAVNAILRNKLALPVAIAFTSFFSLTGCVAPKPSVIYVPGTLAVEPMVHNGAPGWFVPQETFERMIEAITKAKE